MNCPYCDTPTHVTNSRTRSHKVWRRRSCREDHTFTTYETVDTSQINVRKRDSRLEPLQTTKILLSIAKTGVTHTEAVDLESTIRTKLMDSITGDLVESPLSTEQIGAITHRALSAYDQRYGERYRSYSEQL